MLQAHVFYTGTVQGVGFRYTVRRFANDLEVKGWVRNLPDGRVEMLAAGPKEDVERLCGEIDAYFEEYINDKKIEYEDLHSTVQDFRIIL